MNTIIVITYVNNIIFVIGINVTYNINYLKITIVTVLFSNYMGTSILQFWLAVFFLLKKVI